MIVDAVPDVDVGGDRLEQIVIGFRRRQVVTRRGLDLRMIAPRAFLADLALELKRRLAGIIGHLDRQHAALRHAFEQPPHDRRMVGQPLHHRIAEDEVGARVGLPSGDVGFDEAALRQPLARLLEHVGRGIEADDFRLRKALDQKLGRVARPAAEIDDEPRPLQRHLRHQVARRPGPVILEFEILRRAPVFHRLRCLEFDSGGNS